MNDEEKAKLERKFDKELTEGEAAEIKNTEVMHKDDEDFYEQRENDIPSIPPIGFLTGNNE